MQAGHHDRPESDLSNSWRTKVARIFSTFEYLHPRQSMSAGGLPSTLWSVWDTDNPICIIGLSEVRTWLRRLLASLRWPLLSWEDPSGAEPASNEKQPPDTVAAPLMLIHVSPIAHCWFTPRALVKVRYKTENAVDFLSCFVCSLQMSRNTDMDNTCWPGGDAKALADLGIWQSINKIFDTFCHSENPT